MSAILTCMVTLSINLSIEKQMNRLLDVMTDDKGLIQHCDGPIPLKRNENPYPYSIDDNARALIVLARASQLLNFEDGGKHITYLNFIERNRKDNGLVYNYQDLEGNPINDEDDKILDCYGRTMWAWAKTLDSNFLPGAKSRANKNFLDGLKAVDALNTSHSEALSLIALSKYLLSGYNSNQDEIKKVKNSTQFLAEKLEQRFYENSDKNWDWFDDEVSYCAARLPHSMLLAGKVLGDEGFIGIAKKSLDFISNETMFYGDFSPIGNNGWYKRGEHKPMFDQQTIEAGSMTEVYLDYQEILKDEYYGKILYSPFKWFLGKNIKQEPLLSKEGGVYDAITKDGINYNQGAESLLSYLMAATAIIGYENRTKKN